MISTANLLVFYFWLTGHCYLFTQISLTTQLLYFIFQDDVEAMIAEFVERDKRLVSVTEETCPNPSPRYVADIHSFEDN